MGRPPKSVGKGRRRGENENVPCVKLNELFDQALKDVIQYLPQGTIQELFWALDVEPATLRDVLDSCALKAESSLADGGFEAYACLRQLQSLIKKNLDWHASPPAERLAKSMDGFFACEKRCEETNRRFETEVRNPHRNGPVYQVLNLARLKVHEVLGELTEVRYLECLRKADFGPGSPFVPEMGWEDPKGLQWKIAGDQTTTRDAWPHARLALELNDGWLDCLLSAGANVGWVDEGKMSTAPKNATIDRVIEQQPSLLVYLQKGAGSVMAELIRSIGIDLSTQERNHRACRKGSLYGETATVDMTSASDLNARALIEWLFPGTWYDFLNDIRVKWGVTTEGHVFPHQMFSTMGNATTFPIQCLVFYAITWASCYLAGEDSRAIRVYGDDIICPVGAVALLFETLRYCGHIPNVAKTHVWGPMRESCGRDYVQGIDVRPVYLEKCPSTDFEVMSLYNRLALMAFMPLPRTLSYLRNRARDLSGPPDLGSSLDEAYSTMSGESTIKPYFVTGNGFYEPLPSHSAKARIGVSLASDSYFIADPPKPTGYCSAVQSNYWTFRGYQFRAVPVADSYSSTLNWRAILYGARLLESRRGSHDLDDLRFPTSERTTFVPEKYCFWWSDVASVRARLLNNRHQ
jgi:hypothetical protein